MADSLSSSIQLLLGLPDEWAHGCVGVVGLPGCRCWVLGSFGDVQFAAPMLINHFATRHCEPKKKELSPTLAHTHSYMYMPQNRELGGVLGGERGVGCNHQSHGHAPFSFRLLLLISRRKWRNCHKAIEIIYHAIFRCCCCCHPPFCLPHSRWVSVCVWVCSVVFVVMNSKWAQKGVASAANTTLPPRHDTAQATSGPVWQLMWYCEWWIVSANRFTFDSLSASAS